MGDIEVVELEPFGVEVRTDRWPEHTELLKQLFRRHGFLLLRNQQLTMDEQIALLSNFDHVLRTWSGTGYVSNEREDGALGNVELAFHADYMWNAFGYRAISLHAIDVDDGKTSTRYADTMRALERMPSSFRERIEGKQVINLMPQDYGGLQEPPSLKNYPDYAPRATHPIIADDAITGRPSSTVNAMMSAEIVGLPAEESRTLLDEIEDYLYDETNIYEHHWHKGDIVIWSNGAIHHARGAVNPNRPRTLQRVCLADEAEVGPADDFIKEREARMAAEDSWKAVGASSS